MRGKFTRKDKRNTIAQHKVGKGCLICGYNRSTRALELHHVKEGTRGFKHNAGWDSLDGISLKRELDKCIVVCANHHAEIHDGYYKQYLIKEDK